LGYSTAAAGVKPEVKMAPTQICEHVIEAAKQVPFIRSVKLFIVEANGNQKSVNLDYVKALNIQVKDVPNLYTSSPSPLQRIEALEAEVQQLLGFINTLKGEIVQLQEKVNPPAQPPTTPLTEGRGVVRARSDDQ
jgi:hypothetical protein